MKKIFFAIIALSFLFVCFGLMIGIPEAKAQANVDLQAQLNKAAEMKAQDTLKMKEWVIYLTPKVAHKGVASETDVLTFTKGTVNSKYLSSLGYLTSNYTLVIEHDGTASWETMQTDKEEQNIAHLTGGLKNGVMKGVMVIRPKKGGETIYYYSTIEPSVETMTITQTPVEPAKKKR